MISLVDKVRYVQELLASDRSLAAKAIGAALTLRFHNGNTGRCDPSYEALGAAAGLKRRATIDAIRELKDQDWIRIEKRDRPGRSHTNAFRPAFERVRDGAPLSSERVHDGAPFDGSERVHNGAPLEPKGCTIPYERVHDGAPEHTNNVSEERGGADAPSPARPAGGGLDGFEEFWRAFPKRTHRAQAEASFQRVVSSGEATAGQIVAGAIRYAAEVAGKQARYVTTTYKWLDGKRWLDEPGSNSGGPEQPRGRREPPRLDGLGGFTGLAIAGSRS